MDQTQGLAELLRWYVAMGADEAIGAESIDRFGPPPAPAPAPVASPAPVARSAGHGDPSVDGSRALPPWRAPAVLAGAAATLAELEAAVRSFTGCGLKRTATNTVFADGVDGAELMVIGEAPGADEDRIGRPFVGRSGQLLDRMLAAIGYDRRRNAYITNVLFWRPPGNRKPTNEEVAACLPLSGGISRWCGRRRSCCPAAPRPRRCCGGPKGSRGCAAVGSTSEADGLEGTVPAIATYHPSFLLRSPARKGEAWQDLLALQSKLKNEQ